jgi:hypothetical protein
MSKTTYIQVADNLCYSASAAFELLPQPQSLSDFSRGIRRLQPVMEETQRDLHAIPVPAGDEQQLGEWLQMRDRNVREIDGMRDAADAGDSAKFERLSTQVNIDARRASQMAGQYGMLVCGQTP